MCLCVYGSKNRFSFFNPNPVFPPHVFFLCWLMHCSCHFWSIMDPSQFNLFIDLYIIQFPSTARRRAGSIWSSFSLSAHSGHACQLRVNKQIHRHVWHSTLPEKTRSTRRVNIRKGRSVSRCRKWSLSSRANAPSSPRCETQTFLRLKSISSNQHCPQHFALQTATNT